LIVGNCPDNENTVNQNRPIAGTVSDLAVYDYPLGSNEVVGHYSAYFTAATNVVNPVGVTTNESVNNSITLTAVISGNGNTYQWFKDGLALTNNNNPDGTAHYPSINNGVFDIQGVDAPVLVVTQVSPADNGNYVLVVYNRLNAGGQISTTPVAISVAPDLTQPANTGSGALGQYLYGSTAAPGAVQVYFNKRMDLATATNPSNYSIDGGVGIVNAYLAGAAGDTRFAGAYRTVTLLTTALTPGQNYTLTVSGIKDATYTGNLIDPGTNYFTAPQLVKGVTWDYYAAVPGSMGAFTAGQYNNLGTEFGMSPLWLPSANGFPFVPQYETTLTNLDTTQLNAGGTGIGCNPIFGTGTPGSGEGSYYGAILSGWITPTNTDDYTFFLRDDDNAALFLGQDHTPISAFMIAQATGVNTVFAEPNPANFVASVPVHLTQGQSYYIQVIHYQITGSDYVGVAWRSASGSDSATPAASLPPISGQFLTSYGRTAQPVVSAKVSGGSVTVSWTGAGRLVQSSDVSLPVSRWTAVPGNPSSPYTAPVSGAKLFYLIVQ
jgi:hypothetical protein